MPERDASDDEMVAAIREQLRSNQWVGFSAYDAVAFLLDVIARRRRPRA